MKRFIFVILIPGDPGAVILAGRKGATKVFKHRRKSPWVPTLTGLFPNGQENRVRTHERNSGDAVRRLGKIIQSIFCVQSEASIRLTVWKWSGESRYPGALPPMLENFRRAFSPGPTDCPWVSEDEWYFHKRKNFNTFQFLLVHLLSVLLIFLVIVVCRTPAAMLIFLSC